MDWVKAEVGRKRWRRKSVEGRGESKKNEAEKPN
jgi:hypothetical protein